LIPNTPNCVYLWEANRNHWVRTKERKREGRSLIDVLRKLNVTRYRPEKLQIKGTTIWMCGWGSTLEICSDIIGKSEKDRERILTESWDVYGFGERRSCVCELDGRTSARFTIRVDFGIKLSMMRNCLHTSPFRIFREIEKCVNPASSQMDSHSVENSVRIVTCILTNVRRSISATNWQIKIVLATFESQLPLTTKDDHVMSRHLPENDERSVQSKSRSKSKSRLRQ
jgi:hypothetical protein